jgi:hypothetical protein
VLRGGTGSSPGWPYRPAAVRHLAAGWRRLSVCQGRNPVERSGTYVDRQLAPFCPHDVFICSVAVAVILTINSCNFRKLHSLVGPYLYSVHGLCSL